MYAGFDEVDSRRLETDDLSRTVLKSASVRAGQFMRAFFLQSFTKQSSLKIVEIDPYLLKLSQKTYFVTFLWAPGLC